MKATNMRFIMVLLGFFAFGCSSSGPTSPPAKSTQAGGAPKKTEVVKKSEPLKETDGSKKTVTPAPKDDSVTLSTVLADKNRILIDVRTPGEFATGHVPGAINIPLGQEAKMAEAIGAKDRPAVVYCRSGARSGRSFGLLRAHGFTRVVNGGGVASLAREMGVKLVQ